MIDMEKWKDSIEIIRKEKNNFFGSSHPQSPIVSNELSNFKGLEYYPVDSAYRFELKLYEHTEKKIIRIEDSKGGIQTYLRWGEFRFKINDIDYKLQIYKSDPDEERLFLPFRDSTNNKETYGAGRYIDLEPEKNKNSDGKWVIDFNLAYNPWCAYSDAYVCPFVPPESWLKVPIRAGEKKYLH